jgi:hypothetical protein
MKKRFAAVLAAAAMLVAGAFVAPSASADTGNTSDTAKAIAMNTTVTGSKDYTNSCPTSSWDWFKYTIPAKGKVWISASNSGDIVAPYVRLFTSAGSTNTKQSDSSSIVDGGDALAVHRFPAGTYYVAIGDYSPYCGHKGSYKLRVNYVNEGSKLTEVEPDNSPYEATPVNLNTFYTGNIAGSSDKSDWFKYTIPAKGNVRLDMKYQTTSGYSLSMHTSPGHFADYDSTDGIGCNGSDAYCNTSVHSLAAGTYYVKVSDGDDDTDYQLKVEYTSTTPSPVPVYRLYNGKLHLYTTDLNEKNARVSGGWKYEGVSFNASKQGSASGLVPVYREYNHRNGNHNWTLDKHEHDTLVSWGWNDEGIAWYTSPSGPVTVYRLYNHHTGEHVYTTSAKEYASDGAAGWNQEGTAWKGL